jgi:CXXC-20-CXXC protein
MKILQKGTCPKCGYEVKYKDMFSWGVWWDLSCPSCKVQLKIDFTWEFLKAGVLLSLLVIVVILNFLGLSIYILGPCYLLSGILLLPYLTRLRIKTKK